MRISPKRKKRNPRRIGINLRVPARFPLRLVACLATALLCVSMAMAQSKKKGSDDESRTVQGTVTMADGSLAAGAEVQLKNTKTLQVRSYVTQKEGTYFFHGLNSNTDYEVKARVGDTWSSTRTVSSYDSRKDVRMDLKVNPK
jgi:Carboxypeptidase regulatory-like domain